MFFYEMYVNFCMYLFVFSLAVSTDMSAQNSGTGTVSGIVIDAVSGEEMIGAAVKIDGTKLGAICGLEGDFTINNVSAGTYTVIALMVGYTEAKIENVKVTAGEETKI